MNAKPVECVAAEEVGDILDRPESDPRRAHLDTCPRCRALVVSYREFLTAADDESAYGEREQQHLDAVRERLLAGERDAPIRRRVAASAPGGWWERWFGPAMRPAWGFAAVVIAAGAVLFAARTRGPGPEPVLRGGAPRSMELAAPEPRAGGGVVLRWSGDARARAYELRFYSTALVELGTRDAGSDTSVTLAAADLPAAYRSGAVILYRVRALRDGDAIASSPTGTLRRP